MKIVVFLACLSVAFAAHLKGGPTWDRNLIVGGTEAPVGSRPYQAVLFNDPYGGYYSLACGGTLVHERWVVSAAHCVGGDTVYVGFGYHRLDDSGKQIVKGTWYSYPYYNSNNMDHDMAMIYLHTPATLSSQVQTIKIASGGSDPSSGTSLLVSGWGSTSSGGNYPMELRQVVVNVVGRSTCNSNYGGAITSNMVCAAASGKDSCQGDSGGPIVSGYNTGSHVSGTTLEGVVSWGWGCADPSYPGVYARVANYCGWIKSLTQGYGDVSC